MSASRFQLLEKKINILDRRKYSLLVTDDEAVDNEMQEGNVTVDVRITTEYLENYKEMNSVYITLSIH